MTLPWQVVDNGIRIAVRATPRSSRNQLTAGTPEYFIARLTAAPVDGAANAALTALLAATFRVPKRDVSLLAGATSRLKRFQVRGDPSALAGIAGSLYGPPHDG